MQIQLALEQWTHHCTVSIAFRVVSITCSSQPIPQFHTPPIVAIHATPLQDLQSRRYPSCATLPAHVPVGVMETIKDTPCLIHDQTCKPLPTKRQDRTPFEHPAYTSQIPNLIARYCPIIHLSNLPTQTPYNALKPLPVHHPRSS